MNAKTNKKEVKAILKSHYIPICRRAVKKTVTAYNINPIFELNDENRERLIIQYYAGFTA
ncbi:MAG: hypothetical protein JXA96_17270 [Sedimentisphaerales bacterium]|nr:hypothetical protein [Sedimentisphaerales bacterium]